MPTVSTAPLQERSRARQLALLSAWAAALVALLPVVFHWGAHPVVRGLSRALRIVPLYLLVLLIGYGIYRVEQRRLGRTCAVSLLLLTFLLTILINFLHYQIVDQGTKVFPFMTNLQWQVWVHNATVDLSPEVLPHSYRFLPSGIVRWMEIAGISYTSARSLYRFLFGVLLFYALYRYARLYTDHLGGLIAMLLTAVMYPISFLHYAGQLTDPLSHLSFLLCFTFLQAGDFPWFLSAMLIGSLAKESVLAMAGYYLLFCRRDKHYALRSFLVCACAAAFYFGVRVLVLKGKMDYQAVSGVPAQHISQNWHAHGWPSAFLLTAGALMPFLVLDWKRIPASLKQLVLFLLPVLFASTLVFGWLEETRNFMPLVFVLAVTAGSFLSRQSERIGASCAPR